MRDLIIVGAGPAGLSAATNAAAEGLSTLVLESDHRIGGQAGASSRIENYPGFPDGVSGRELTCSTLRQSDRLGAEVLTGITVRTLKSDSDHWSVKCSAGTMRARAVLLTVGVDYRKLDVPGAADERVRYGVTSEEHAEYAGQRVAIIGAANSAAQAALNLARVGAIVTLLARRTLDAGMSAYLLPRIREEVDVREHAPVRYLDDLAASGVRVWYASDASVDVDYVLPYIGADPRTEWVQGVCGVDTRGYVVTMPDSYQTAAPGLFAAGDVRSGSRKRVATAVGEGAAAIAEIYRYVREQVPA